MQTVVISSAIVLGLMLFAPAEGTAQSSPLYIQFSPSAIKGALYKPNAGPAPHVGILAIHRTSNFTGYSGCTELSKRGFLVLCMNPRFDNNEAAVRWEDIALDVRSGVSFLRRQPGIAKVILWGFSGGGPTTTFYQAVAENGPSYCQGPRKLTECGDDLAGLPPADGLILVDAHPGNSVNGIRSLNAAVTNDAAIVNDNQRARIDPDLDPFSPRNGYNPKGASTYSESFKKRYFAAQAARMNRLIDLALAKSGEMKKGVYPYPDDDAFIVLKGSAGRLLEMDSSIHHGTVRPQKLLKNDGAIARQIVESVRQPNPDLAGQDRTFNGGARLLTIRSFLSANAIRATDSMTISIGAPATIPRRAPSGRFRSRSSSRRWADTTSSGTTRFTTTSRRARTRTSSSLKEQPTGRRPVSPASDLQGNTPIPSRTFSTTSATGLTKCSEPEAQLNQSDTTLVRRLSAESRQSLPSGLRADQFPVRQQVRRRLVVANSPQDDEQQTHSSG